MVNIKNKITILIVDDDDNFRSIIRAKLEAAGLFVLEAMNGQEGIEMAKSQKPNLLVLDVNMPKMSGIETLSKIKADPQTADLSVVFLTNFGESDNENAWVDDKFAQDIGALGHIKKTDDLDKIIEKIKQLLPVSFDHSPEYSN